MLNSEDYKISIIVPAYNIAEYLPRCLDSILAQTHTNIEVIVVSDGSTDGTDKIIKQYEEKDDRVIGLLKENTGVSDTRNKGIDHASGEYIGFVDGDDFVEPDMYEILLENALSYGADISHCGYQMVFPSRVVFYHNTGELSVSEGIEGLNELIKADKVEPGVWSKLYHRSIMSDVRFDSDLIYFEDLMFNVLAFQKSKRSVFFDKPFYHYMIRKNSAATGGLTVKKIRNVITIHERIIGLLANENDSPAKKRFINTLIDLYRNYCLKSDSEFIRSKLAQNKDYIGLLSLGRKAEARLILYLPHVYRLLIRIYQKYIYKNPYEVE